MKPESQPKDPAEKLRGDDLEAADLRRGADVSAAARAGIIIPDPDDPDRLAGVFRKFLEVEPPARLLFPDILFCHREIERDDLIDLSLNGSNLQGRQRPVKVVVALGFLLFNVGAERPSPVEHPHHGLVQDMLRRMHTRVVLFGH